MNDPAPPNDRAHRRTILIVDDTPENLAVLKSLLEETYRIRAANNGERALAIALSADPPDMVLLDIMMPQMDGYEVCRRIKADEAAKNIPIMFLTAKVEPEDEVAGFDLGAVDYVTKPVNPHRLLARVRAQLELAEARRRLAEQNAELVEAGKLRDDVERITRHDLKAPLTAIIGVPQFILENCDLDATQKELVQGIEDAGRRMLQMINSSLDLFKMERGTYELRPVPVDLIETARTVFFELEQLAQYKAVPLVLHSRGATPGVGDRAMALGEPLLCHSLLANLCKNAVEASPDGEAVMVSVNDGAETSVVIENAGEVAQEIADRFFEKFTTAGKDTGTGLGTYSAKLNAKIQNGSIALDRSTPGRTRVRVLLPSSNPNHPPGLAKAIHGGDEPHVPNRF